MNPRSETNIYPVADNATVEEIERVIRYTRNSTKSYIECAEFATERATMQRANNNVASALRFEVEAERFHLWVAQNNYRAAELELMRHNLIEARDRDNAIVAPLHTQHNKEA